MTPEALTKVPSTAADICWTLAPAVPSESDDDDPIVDAVIETMAFRTLAREAIHQLAAMQREYGSLERRYHRLLDERAVEGRPAA